MSDENKIEDLNKTEAPVEAKAENEEVLEKSEEEAEKKKPSFEELFIEKEKELLYLRAEFENFKRQSIKERSDLLKYAGESMARDILNTLDVFEKALSQEITEENYKNFVEGISLTADQLSNDLKKHGIEEIDCKGKPFDPNTCEALSQIPSADVEEGHVIEVMRKGFKYRDKVLRYAQVVTATAPS